MSKIIPNTFQTFNVYVDTAMELITPEEYKCLSFATRHILGWQDKINKRQGVISVTMFENGFTTQDGTHFGGTGLHRSTIIKAVDELTRFEFLVKQGEPTPDGQCYELGDLPRWDLMLDRREERLAAARKRTEKSRTAAADKRQADKQGGLSDRPVDGSLSDRPEVVYAIDQGQSMGQTGAGLSHRRNQNQEQNQDQSQDQNFAPEGAGNELGELSVEGENANTGSPETPPSSATPPTSPRPRNPIFDAVAQHIFGNNPMELDEDVGGRIGPISSWLEGKSDGVGKGRARRTVGKISAPAKPEHIQKFATDWKAEHSNASLPLDLVKFAEHWRAWASTQNQRLTQQGQQAAKEAASFGLRPVQFTDEQLRGSR